MFGPKNAFVSGLVSITRADVSLLEKVHVLILDFCRKNCFVYIDNRNIKSDSLYKDKGKAISTTLYQGGGKNMLTLVSCLSHIFSHLVFAQGCRQLFNFFRNRRKEQFDMLIWFRQFETEHSFNNSFYLHS